MFECSFYLISVSDLPVNSHSKINGTKMERTYVFGCSCEVGTLKKLLRSALKQNPANRAILGYMEAIILLDFSCVFSV